jgi:4-hydroxy-2-oxoheptanedioate aldolase
MTEVLEDRSHLDPALEAYLEGYARDKVMVVNIESVPAMDALDEMLAVPGVDALLIGPHDLSINLGIPEQYRHAKFTEAVRLIVEKGRAAGVGVGFHYSFGIQEALDWAALGANFIVHSSDYFLTRDALRRDLAQFREVLGDGRADAGEGEAVII